ncbi:hypothetical protein MHU86_16314 [Fragilaria crotonensis]|nr:hypothetical protein MHU86_16314 [Fragilaria crotonensis]
MGLLEWSKEFQAVDCGTESMASSEDVKEATEFIDKADLFRTPSKRKRDPKDVGPFGEDWEFLNHERMLPIDADVLDQTIRTGITKEFLTKTLATVETSMVTMGGALEDVARVTLERFVANERDAMLMAGAIQSLKTNLGAPMAVIDVKFESPTLWGTTSFIVDEVNRVGESLAGLEADILPFKISVNEFIESHDPTEAKHKADRFLEILTMVMQKMKQISPEFEAMKASIGGLLEEKRTWEKRLDEMEFGLSGRLKKARFDQRAGDSVDDLMKMMSDNSMHTQNEQHDRYSTPPGGTGDGFEKGGSDGLRQEMERRLDMFDVELRVLKTAGDGNAVKFGGLGFRSVNECHEWAVKNFPGNRYGLIMDPLLMLDRICGADDIHASASNTWKTMESRIKLKITTGAEAAALEALNNLQPRIFHKGRPAMMYLRNTSRLSKLMKQTDWKSGGGGVREHIVKQMNILHSSVTQDINHALGGRVHLSQAHLIATHSLTATVTSITQLVGAIDAIYEKLHVQSKFSSDAAWCLTMQILDKVCEELFVPKDGVMQAMTLGDPESICAHVLYASFRSQDIMAGYVEHQFENHPSVSTEFIRFLLPTRDQRRWNSYQTR